jgi:hypothetical protein
VARYQDAEPGSDPGGDADPGGHADPDAARRVIVVLHAFPMDPIP